MPKVVLTVPHSYCEGDVACDVTAGVFADEIKVALRENGVPVTVFKSDRPRETADMNRKVSRETSFRKKVDALSTVPK